MNVLYDISMLGFGHSLSIYRSGIFRVVEHGARGLIVSDQCKATFCASQNNYLQCNQYLASQHEFSSNRLNLPDDLLSRFYSYIEPARVDVHKHPVHVLKNNLVRFFYHTGKRYTRPISRRDIASADIYHSPASPIPAQVIECSKIIPFITIHDIIPLVYNDIVSRASQTSMKTILDSIKPETFVMCVSQYTKDDLCNYLPHLDPDRLKVSYLAAGEQFYRCSDTGCIAAVRKKCGIPEEAFYMLSLGTLQPRKNLVRTIRCFVNMLKESHIQNLYLVLVGAHGIDYENILIEIEKAGEFRNRILISGYLPDEYLAPLYSGSLAFLYLSFYEGFGLPPLEAMQCGTAVLTSNTTSLPEVVGNAAIMVDPTDDDAICQGMLELYHNEELRCTLAQKSLLRAKEFSWIKFTEHTLAAYQKAL